MFFFGVRLHRSTRALPPTGSRPFRVNYVGPPVIIDFWTTEHANERTKGTTQPKKKNKKQSKNQTQTSQRNGVKRNQKKTKEKERRKNGRGWGVGELEKKGEEEGMKKN